MAETIQVTCPHCQKPLRVPAAVAGKTIRCKDCQTAFQVPGAAPADDAPVKAKKVKKATAAKPADDNDNDLNPYGVTKDDLDVARCPFCAEVLDPPDTKVCLTCGYDLLARRRHESRKVYAYTFGDYFQHFLPAIGCVLVVAALVALNVVCYLNMRDWFEGSFLEKDNTNATTGKKEFWVGPGLCQVWIAVPSLFMMWKAGKFAFRRFVYDWRPPETLKR